jgi:caa(3)-type oxidase subunit IV
MGSANLPISLVIAAVKAALVGAVFMRLFKNNPINRLAAAAGPVWVFVMFLLMFADYFTR